MNKLELLSRDHDREHFDCGVEPLNAYLRGMARQHIEKQISMTYVLVDEAATVPKPVLGYFTVGMCEVMAADMSLKFAKKYPPKLPAIRLGRLAIDHRQQGKRLGKALLFAAIKHYWTAAESVGGVALIVDAKNEKAAEFYRHFGFQPFTSDPLKLYMPLGTVRQLFAIRNPKPE